MGTFDGFRAGALMEYGRMAEGDCHVPLLFMAIG